MVAIPITFHANPDPPPWDADAENQAEVGAGQAHG